MSTKVGFNEDQKSASAKSCDTREIEIERVPHLPLGVYSTDASSQQPSGCHWRSNLSYSVEGKSSGTA